MASADLLLHPVRLRIVKAFLGDRALTTAELAAELDDVPAGSLYRHIGLLARAGVLQVVAERQARGAVERTYTLRPVAAQLQQEEVAAMSLEDHARAFMAYVAGLLVDFDRYLGSGRAEPGRDGADYRLAAMWLTEAEFAEFMRDLRGLLQSRMANPPGGRRRRRVIYAVNLPAPGPLPARRTPRPASRRKAGPRGTPG